MSDYCCSRGCECCDGTEAGGHYGGCCGSTICNSRKWNKQVETWLRKEAAWKKQQEKQQDKMVTRWLLAEALHLEQQRQAEQRVEPEPAPAVPDQSELRAKLRLKSAKVVHVERKANSPKIAAARRQAVAAHGR